MFLLIPLVIVFLALSYLYLNDVNMIITVFVYIFISFTLLISFYLYKYIKKDLKQQKLNQIQKEINILQNKLLNLTDIKQQEHIKHKIELLKQEFQQNLYD